MGRKTTGVWQKSQTSIEISFQYKGQRFREVIKLKPTPANLKKAARHREAILYAIEKGTFDYATTFPNSPNLKKLEEIDPSYITLENYLLGWLEDQQKRLSASTTNGYKKIIKNRLIPAFGSTYIKNLSKSEIRDWLKSLDCSNKTLSNIQSVLRKSLSDAYEYELIESNPMYRWTYKNADTIPDRYRIDPFSSEEQRAIINSCHPWIANLFQFAFWTGLRTSELIALEWTDIDYKRNVIIIDKAITEAAKGKIEVTKTKSSSRTVTLLKPALMALESQAKLTRKRYKNIFISPYTKKMWTGDSHIRKNWVKALEKGNVRYRRPYQTRHTFASMLLSSGEHPMWVAQQMGHKDWTMIAKIYGKFIQSLYDKPGSLAESKFWEESTGSRGEIDVKSSDKSSDKMHPKQP